MPNAPRPDNPAHPIRFGVLWGDVERIAADDGTTASEVVREAVRQYVTARHTPADGRKHGLSCLDVPCPDCAAEMGIDVKARNRVKR